MTLFEALVALVILGLAAGASLAALQGTSRATRTAEEWVQVIGYAEATMEQTKRGTAPAEPSFFGQLPSGFTRQVAVQPWIGLRGIERVTVTVAFPDGGTFVLHRLVRSR